MKLVFDHIDFTTVGHMQSMLEAEGIPTELRNLGNSGLAGEVPFGQTFPEIWVLNDADETRARDFIRDYRSEADSSPASAPAAWTCPQCHERVDGNFARCWNCETPAPATA